MASVPYIIKRLSRFPQDTKLDLEFQNLSRQVEDSLNHLAGVTVTSPGNSASAVLIQGQSVPISITESQVIGLPGDLSSIFGSITTINGEITVIDNTLTTLVPYIGANQDVNLGTFNLYANTISGLNGVFSSLQVDNLSGVVKASLGTLAGGATTSDLPEGSNLYYTDVRVRAALSKTDPITYNSVSGIIGLAYNTTNLRITATELNTIQDISTTATPNFGGLILTANISGLNAIFTGYGSFGDKVTTFDGISPLTTIGDLITWSGGHNIRLPGSTAPSSLSSPLFLAGFAGQIPFWSTPPVSALQTFWFTNSGANVAGHATWLQMPQLNSPPGNPLATISAGTFNVGNHQEVATWICASGLPNSRFIPDGVWHVHIHARKTGAGQRDTDLHFHGFKYTASGTQVYLFQSSDTAGLTNAFAEYDLTAVTPSYNLLPGERIGIDIMADVSGTGNNVTVELQVDGQEAPGDITNARVELPATVVDSSTFIPYTGAVGDMDFANHSMASILNLSLTGTLTIATLSGILHATLGVVSGAAVLENLSNVLITSITDGQSLAWNSSLSKWVNTTISGGGGGGSIGGSIANTQVAVGNGTNTIAGSSAFTFDGTNLQLTGAFGIGVTPLYPFHVYKSSSAAGAAPIDVAAIEVHPTDALTAGFGPALLFKDLGYTAHNMARIAAIYDLVGVSNLSAITFSTDGGVGLVERARIDHSGNLTVTGTVSGLNLSGTNTGDQSVETLTDAQITSVSDGQLLTWSSSLSKWINTTISGGSIGGSITNQQVAFGTGTNTIGGSSHILWNGTTFTLSGTLNIIGSGIQGTLIDINSSSQYQAILGLSNSAVTLGTGGQPNFYFRQNPAGGVDPPLILEHNGFGAVAAFWKASISIGKQTIPAAALDVVGDGIFSGSITLGTTPGTGVGAFYAGAGTFTGIIQTTGQVAAGILQLSSGDTITGATVLSQIRFGYQGSTNYPHWVVTNHNAFTPVGNRIRFFTSDGTPAGVYPANGILGLTIENGAIDVPGAGVFGGALSASNLSGTNTGDQSVDSLTNVVITAVSDGQVLTWNAGTSKWINAAGGATTITLSGDVTGTGTSSITTDVSDGLRRHFLL